MEFSLLSDCSFAELYLAESPGMRLNQREGESRKKGVGLSALSAGAYTTQSTYLVVHYNHL
jgi:hypothetical protein